MYIHLITIHTIFPAGTNAYRTLHDATQRDTPRQENRVMCGGLRHDKTKIGPCRRYLALLDHSRRGLIFVVSRRVIDPRTLHDFLSGVVASSRVESRRVV